MFFCRVVVPFSEIPVYLGACDIQLLPMKDMIANRARVPNKIFDYYASGRPVVTSNIGDTGDYVRIHGTGLTAEDTPGDFARSMIELAITRELAEQTGKNARIIAEKEFCSQLITRNLLSFYFSIGKGLDENIEKVR